MSPLAPAHLKCWWQQIEPEPSVAPESPKFLKRSLRSCWVFDGPLGCGHRRPLERNFYVPKNKQGSSFLVPLRSCCCFDFLNRCCCLPVLGLFSSCCNNCNVMPFLPFFFNGLSPRQIPFAPTTALALKTNMEFSKKLRKICTRHSYVVHIHKLKKVLFANEAMNSRKQVKVRQCKSVLFLF